MLKLKKILSIAIVLWALCACEKKPEVIPIPVTSVALNFETAGLLVGESYHLQVIIKPSDATDQTVTWSSSDNSVVTVDQQGVITGKSAGTATVTATCNGLSASCLVTVSGDFVPVESVTLELDYYVCYPGGSFTILATVLPENATDKTITWTSSDSNAVSVTQDGVVTCHAEAEVTVTARAGNKEASCIVHCVHDPDSDDEHDGESNGHTWVDLGLPSGIKWATCNVGAYKSSEIGDKFAWGETFARESSENPPYTWYNSATDKFTKYVTDSYYGKVDNLTTLEPNDDAAHVRWGGDWRMPTAADAMELVENSAYSFVEKDGVWGAKLTSKNNGHSIFLPVVYDDLKDGCYLTSSLLQTSISNVYTFDNESIDPYSKGVFRGGICPVRAVIGTTAYIPVKSVAFETSTLDITAGETKALSVTVLPENASHREVTWTSSNPDAATVDNKGNLTAVGTGQATITATADGVTANLYVTVRPRFESISINPSYMELEPGETASVTVTVTPVEYLDYCQYGYANRSINIMDVEPTDNKLKFNITAKAGGDGTFDFHVYVNDSPMTVRCRVTVLSDDEFDGETDGHKWVDLGLPSGIKWATCNVGANYSSQIGSKFGWGEITPSDDDSTPYKWYDSSTGKYLKYVTNAAYGEVDNLTTLLPEDDAAHVNWGGNWRMPTADEIKELEENCTYEVVTKKGVVLGGKITSKLNSHSIFIPMYRGEYVGYCRSSSMNQLQTDKTIVLAALYREFGRDILERNKRASVRAVIGTVPLIHVMSVDFGFSHDFRTVGDVIQYSVNISPSNATYKTVTWSSSDESVATVDKNGKVTCLKAGDTLIYAEADGKSDRFVLKVSPAATFLALNPSKISMHVGETQTINISLTPRGPYQTFESGADGDISYYIETDDDNVPVRLVIIATKVGTYSVYFGAGGKRATCEVTVLE